MRRSRAAILCPTSQRRHREDIGLAQTSAAYSPFHSTQGSLVEVETWVVYWL